MSAAGAEPTFNIRVSEQRLSTLSGPQRSPQERDERAVVLVLIVAMRVMVLARQQMHFRGVRCPQQACFEPLRHRRRPHRVLRAVTEEQEAGLPFDLDRHRRQKSV